MIQFIGKPNPGENFKYILEGKRGVNHIVVATLDGSKIYDHQSECDDPPCHEMIYIEPEFAGKTIAIEYRNSIGESQSLSFYIELDYLQMER